MISLRHHTVSIAAVFLALALGVVLGSTSLSERLLAGVRAESQSMDGQIATLEPERDTLRAELARAHRFIRSIGPMAVQGQLDQRTVTLISTADVSDSERQRIRDVLHSAGAAVTGDLRFTDGLGDPNREEALRSIATTLMPSGAHPPVAADTGTLVGGLLTALTTVDPDTGMPRSSPDESEAVFRGLADGGFAHVPHEAGPSDLTVVLAGGRVIEDHPGDRAAVIAHLAGQVGRTSAGAVLAGRTGSAEGSGAVGVARADTSISSLLTTVDNTDSPSGQVALVIALREQWEGESGHYGIAGSAEGELPSSRE